MCRYMIIPNTILTRMLAVVGFILVLTSAECWSAEPTLARLSFWVPPERIAEFETAYGKLVPILNRHGLVESSQLGRVTVDSVFGRLFAFQSLSEVITSQEALEADPRWKAMLRDLGLAFGTMSQVDSLIQYDFALYMTPSGSGTRVTSGPGKVLPSGSGTGHWRTYDETDGEVISSILQDREGYLWFATTGGGVRRYDGQAWTTFTTQDGLASNSVNSMILDREGHLL